MEKVYGREVMVYQIHIMESIKTIRNLDMVYIPGLMEIVMKDNSKMT